MKYTIQRNRRSRNLRLRITQEAEVVVSAPLRVSERTIEQFIQQHWSWITRHQQTIQQTRQQKREQQTVFGQAYQRVVHDGSDLRPDHAAYLRGEQLHIHPVSQTAASTEKTVTNFLKNTAQKYIIPRTAQLAKTMEIAYASVSLRDQKTRWGSCSSSGALSFNWRLVQYPPAIIDYVIIHELAHRRQMNHSARFWALVAKFDPEYQAHRRWLRQHGSTVE